MMNRRRGGRQMRRDRHGIRHVMTDTEADMYWEQGYAHGTDRGLQMLLMRIIGQGRLSELVDSSDASLRVDKLSRRANWTAGANSEIQRLSAIEQQWLWAYARGASAAFADRPPWEVRLCRHRAEPWRPEDCVLMLRMMSYLTLAQSQGMVERLLVEMVQAGVSANRLAELFPGLLGGLDTELIRRVTLGERIVAADLWGQAVPRLMASNNWVLSGRRTRTGKPILANDVHLEGNRLPAVWYEISLGCGGRCTVGGSLPGIPGILSGRNADVAWGVTYGFVDQEDSWIERCQNGTFYREEQPGAGRWIEFSNRTEVIKRRGKEPVTMSFFENPHGTLDGDPHVTGHYLATRWAGAEHGAGALQASLRLPRASTVEEALSILSGLESGWNCVAADRHGDIGYRLTGLVPRRRPGISGLVPLPGWESRNDWQGFVPTGDLPQVRNPESGYFATANEDLNEYGRVSAINMPMGPYRAERIRELLAERSDFCVEDMFEIQFDVYSRQAGLFMGILRPLLQEAVSRHGSGDSANPATILLEWDLGYGPSSEGAYLFERFYESLINEVFGDRSLGEAAVGEMRRQSGVFIDFYHNFDRVLLAKESAWFGGRTREDLYRRAIHRAAWFPVRKWGEVNRLKMKNLFFRGRLPRWMGFDKGPFAIRGSRATVHQAQFYRSDGRETSFLPSFRIVSDLASGAAFMNLAGGPSDRRFSRWYCSDVRNWLKGEYKFLTTAGETSPEPRGPRDPL